MDSHASQEGDGRAVWRRLRRNAILGRMDGARRFKIRWIAAHAGPWLHLPTLGLIGLIVSGLVFVAWLRVNQPPPAKRVLNPAYTCTSGWEGDVCTLNTPPFSGTDPRARPRSVR